ncbi:hypothetical protein EVJ58_g9948 [Rhodofomes roseus]|uniref:Cysteine-rich protein 1 n=1 Tax=Rhodofomes roseus TaxID=34475 RepID=A0A4Y9XTU0_9APHY|nr:hypothetical protein EVJ58_g9948 [Rhodofomes roseus]
MGPGRRLYHKPCLACTSCGKRLDSYNLLEHDQEPYCKNCHMRLFATRTLGLQNLPNRDEVPLSSPPTSPTRNSFSLTRAASPPARSSAAPPLPARRHATGGSIGDRSAFPAPSSGPPDRQRRTQVVAKAGSPRTVPLSPVRNRFGGSISSTANGAAPSIDGESAGAASAGRTCSPDARMTGTVPLVPTSTGTRYGMALGGRSPMTPMMTGTGRQWGLGGANPLCGKCGKTVYFAEQVKAIGKTYHKGCLRCSECNTSLDSTRLTERDGNPYCHRCYSKLYGPQGSGYALLGKAGG